jgi:hypothetical protein
VGYAAFLPKDIRAEGNTMPHIPELWRPGASQVAKLVRTREVSAIEVVQAALARLDAVNPALNAVVEHRPEEIMAQARSVDEAIAHGRHVGPAGRRDPRLTPGGSSGGAAAATAAAICHLAHDTDIADRSGIRLMRAESMACGLRSDGSRRTTRRPSSIVRSAAS